MPNTIVENQIRITNIELNKKIALLEEALQFEKTTVAALQFCEKRYRRLFESAKDGILILDADTGRIVDVNPFLLQLLGYSYDVFCGKHIWELGVFKDIVASRAAFRVLQDNEYIRYENLPLETHDGRVIHVEFVSNVYLVGDSKVVQCNVRDITERRRADEALQDSELRLRTILQTANEGFWLIGNDNVIMDLNPRMCAILGENREEVLGRKIFDFVDSGNKAIFERQIKLRTQGEVGSYEITLSRPDGSNVFCMFNATPLFDGLGNKVGSFAMVTDISKQKLEQEEREKLQRQFNQAQKMESVGRLAGGVAHDFNNMLGVILGYTELSLNNVDPTHPLHANLKEIYKAAIRSADITRQLLAFARKQTIIPVVFDMNRNVERMLKMLQRLIGEDIDVAWLPAMDLWPVKMDPVQIDEMLANLCVNAKDAIADVGRIAIETGNAVFDETYCANHAGFVAGEYVLLRVSDNGCGMDRETLDKLFEPFFTTKELGKGTGLGLAMVYGVVKQNNGFIKVDSELGKGTTFRVYLPRYAAQAVETEREAAAKTAINCGETVLVVEDEPSLKVMAKRMLEKLEPLAKVRPRQ